jgi:hypothetical protein
MPLLYRLAVPAVAIWGCIVASPMVHHMISAMLDGDLRRALDADDVAHTQAYRRVGRRTRTIDFLWLRGSLDSDPLLILDGYSGGDRADGE